MNHYGPPNFFFGPLLKKFAHHCLTPSSNSYRTES